MQFTEVIFAVFLTVVFSLYWLPLRKSLRCQNLLLLTASYIFYGWWDWRFLGLIMLTTASTFLSGLTARSTHGRLVTTANIVLNIGILVAFKYFNFFSDNLQRLFGLMGWNLDWFTIDVLLPVGISFYTFQAVAYSVDVYKGRIEPCRNPVAFATFIAYFPQLVAGPIERASQLLPQIQAPRHWDSYRAVTGLRMVLFGVLKKVCVADMLAIYADRLFADSLQHPAANLLAALIFTLEIYCDFSAYSEIARGVSRLLGIELMANFRFPYFSRNIVEFWQRWHISLMWWFRDYLYIPLGGNRRGRLRTAFNTALVFLVSGLWHGAAWNFIAWGAYWAIVYLIGKLALDLRRRETAITLHDLPDMIPTFGAVTFGFYIFRCSDWSQIMAGISNLWVYAASFGLLWIVAKAVTSWRFTRMLLAVTVTAVCLFALYELVITNALALLLLKAWWVLPAAVVAAVEWRNRNRDHALERMSPNPLLRLTFYWVCLTLIVLSEPVDMTFIYFQF